MIKCVSDRYVISLDFEWIHCLAVMEDNDFDDSYD
jgi:hypothetical protein